MVKTLKWLQASYLQSSHTSKLNRKKNKTVKSLLYNEQNFQYQIMMKTTQRNQRSPCFTLLFYSLIARKNVLIGCLYLWSRPPLFASWEEKETKAKWWRGKICWWLDGQWQKGSVIKTESAMTASLERAQQPSNENRVDPQIWIGVQIPNHFPACVSKATLSVIQGDLLCIRKYVSMYVVCSHCLEGVNYIVVLKNQLSSWEYVLHDFVSMTVI